MAPVSAPFPHGCAQNVGPASRDSFGALWLAEPMNELPKGFVSASHAVLFEVGVDRCSVCSATLPEDGADEETRVRGRGLLVWARGDERRYEEPHLCPDCASAIGMTALSRWEIEEDEG